MHINGVLKCIVWTNKVRTFLSLDYQVFLDFIKRKKRQLAKLFMRVHRSYIVTLCKIAEISRLRIIFDRNTYIPVGESYKERFTEYIEKLM